MLIGPLYQLRLAMLVASTISMKKLSEWSQTQKFDRCALTTTYLTWQFGLVRTIAKQITTSHPGVDGIQSQNFQRVCTNFTPSIIGQSSAHLAV